jgi:hypothetical protein
VPGSPADGGRGPRIELSPVRESATRLPAAREPLEPGAGGDEPGAVERGAGHVHPRLHVWAQQAHALADVCRGGMVGGVVVLEGVQALEHGPAEHLEQLPMRHALAGDEARPLAYIEQAARYLACPEEPQVAARAQLIEHAEGAHQRSVEREQVHVAILTVRRRRG